jgi:hypothetical protein
MEPRSTTTSEVPPMNVVRRAVLALSLWIVASWAVPVIAQDAERFESAAARFSFTKPAGWSFVSHEGETELGLSAEDWQHLDEEMRKELRKKLEGLVVPLPLVTIVKTVGSSEVAVTVVLMPLPPGSGNVQARKILERSFAEAKKLFPDIKLETPMRELTVSGRRAAEYVARYTLPIDGEEIPMRTASIVVPRDRTLFLIGLVVTQPGDDPHLEEFGKVVSSITIGD